MEASRAGHRCADAASGGRMNVGKSGIDMLSFKSNFSISIFIFVCLATIPTDALSKTTYQLLQECNDFEKSVILKPSPTGDIASLPDGKLGAAICLGYFLSVHDFSKIYSNNEASDLGICAPKETRTVHFIKIFTTYAQKHLETLSQEARLTVLRSLRTTYPCP